LGNLTRVIALRPAPKFIQAALLLSASILAHFWLILASRIFENARPFGDLSLYSYWSLQVNSGADIFGLETDWIYPALALLPIWVPSLAGGLGYELAWLTMILVLNTIAILVLALAPSKSSVQSSWWFVLGLILLGPVAISRIDSISVVLAVFGILFVGGQRFSAAASLFTLAGWIKIWPIALFLAMLVSFKNIPRILIPAVVVSLAILLVGWQMGGSSVLGFLAAQQNRGIQIESVLSTGWMWSARLGLSEVYFDQDVLTNQITGPLTLELAAVSNWMMLIAVGFSLALALRALRAGANPREVFVWASLAGVLNLIVFNKVGSPQFMIWLLVPLVAGVYFGIPKLNSLLALSMSVLALTQLVYPVFYLELLALEPLPLVLLTIRNSLLVALLVIGNLRLAGKKAL